MPAGPWNHNIHYHDIVLGSIPADCCRALDVGCGQGLLARRLAERCGEVIALDIDQGVLHRAKEDCPPEKHIIFLLADVMTNPFSLGSFDFIAAVATLHHLPLRPALKLFRSLLRPGGRLAIIGLYRGRGLRDYPVTSIAFPASWILRCFHRGYADVGAAVRPPAETLDDIRAACADVLPGAILQRRLLFRYSLIWRNLA